MPGGHAVEKILSHTRIVQTAFFFDGQAGHGIEQRLCEEATSRALNVSIDLDTDSIDAAAWRVLLQHEAGELRAGKLAQTRVTPSVSRYRHQGSQTPPPW